MNRQQFSTDIGGKKLEVEFNDLALRADGSVLVRYGNSVVLVTAVMSEKPKDGIDFFPLTVDYEEKFYASGKILGSRFLRREGRPSDEAILSGRIVDRTIRPLFDQYIRNEVQVIVTVLSIDQEDPDTISVIGASLALGSSSIPWNGPASTIRIAKNKSGETIINPTYTEREAGLVYEILACGKDGKINMIEMGGQEISEEEVIKALELASVEIEKIQNFQKEVLAKVSKNKRHIEKPMVSDAIINLYKTHIAPKIHDAIFISKPGDEHIRALSLEWSGLLEKELSGEKTAGTGVSAVKTEVAMNFLEEEINKTIHKAAIEEGRRVDGRGMDEIRPLYAQAGGLSSIVHGSGIFYRGQTHILSVLTLGGPQDAQLVEGMEEHITKRFMHHYNFPPFSTGETGRVGSTNRRMIGHGALAEKALEAVIPDKEHFPYTIRLVSEALSSNGSTSMGSVCGSTLALLDGGVPIKSPVAGIASGLMMEEVHGKGSIETKYKVLTDIQGPEDHYGDMDFKVAGTKAGITAIQMDVKISGVPVHIFKEAFEKAKLARLKILEVMEKAIAYPRSHLSPNAPHITTVKIKPDQIGLIIGSGGKTIKEIMGKTSTTIDINDDGTVYISGKNGGSDQAHQIIYDMTREFQKGERFEGEVTRLMDFGAFVKITENAEGLVHISEIAPFRIDKVDKYLKEGQKVPVVVKEIDEKKRINLSIKEANPTFFKQ